MNLAGSGAGWIEGRGCVDPQGGGGGAITARFETVRRAVLLWPAPLGGGWVRIGRVDCKPTGFVCAPGPALTPDAACPSPRHEHQPLHWAVQPPPSWGAVRRDAEPRGGGGRLYWRQSSGGGVLRVVPGRLLHGGVCIWWVECFVRYGQPLQDAVQCMLLPVKRL